MNITYIIGNGFDISIGLKTSYADFMEDYLSETYNDSDEVKRFKETIKSEQKEDINTWSDVELALGRSTLYFSKQDAPGKCFKECYKDIYEKLCSYLEREQLKIKKSDINKIICENFIENINDFTRGLRPTDVTKLNENYSTIGGGNSYSFISFNYTNVLDKMIDRIKTLHLSLGYRNNNSSLKNRLGDVFHPHGCVDHHNVVFGVDNEEQLFELSIFESCHDSVKKYMIKNDVDELFGEKADEIAYDVLRQSDLIYIYGASIGETDSTWWKRIIELMLEKRNVEVIIYNFELSKYNSSWTRLDSEPIRDDFLSGFLRYGLLSDEEIEILRNRIFIVSYNIFKEFSEDMQDVLYEKSVNKRSEK